MKISFDFNPVALTRIRNLKLDIKQSGRFPIPPTAEYSNLLQFSAKKGSTYPFKVWDLIHATAIKMFERKMTRYQSLFAAGGLYLAFLYRTYSGSIG